MQITLKQVGEYGVLSRPAKIAGWTLMGLAAVCCVMGGVLTIHSASQLVQGLEGKSSAEIQQAVAGTIGLNSAYIGLFWLAIALVILSVGCFLFGRRTSPTLPGKEG
jgi:hypothetical protein